MFTRALTKRRESQRPISLTERSLSPAWHSTNTEFANSRHRILNPRISTIGHNAEGRSLILGEP